jgi:hypothetical protein
VGPRACLDSVERKKIFTLPEVEPWSSSPSIYRPSICGVRPRIELGKVASVPRLCEAVWSCEGRLVYRAILPILVSDSNMNQRSSEGFRPI